MGEFNKNIFSGGLRINGSAQSISYKLRNTVEKGM
jgi:hypothetical protein